MQCSRTQRKLPGEVGLGCGYSVLSLPSCLFPALLLTVSALQHSLGSVSSPPRGRKEEAGSLCTELGPGGGFRDSGSSSLLCAPVFWLGQPTCRRPEGGVAPPPQAARGETCHCLTFRLHLNHSRISPECEEQEFPKSAQSAPAEPPASPCRSQKVPLGMAN